MMLGKTLVRLSLIGGLGGLVGAFAMQATAEEARPYEVVCEANKCQVDQRTYIGWRVYHSSCYQCHAQDGVGSTFAPSLVTRLQNIDKERFIDVVQNGFQGQIGVMPAWKDNPNVNKRLEELYAYLKARADGVLPGGRPGRLDTAQK